MPPGPDPPDKFSNNRFHLLGDYIENASKKQKPNNYPDLPTPRIDINSNPKYVVISSSDPKKSLSDISPFALQKSIEAISKEINSISQLRDGNLLILARSPRVADKFLKTKSLGSFCSVSCKLHSSLNSVKGVIYAPCLKKVPEEEIVNEMKNQGVIEAYKFTKVNEDGKTRSPTGKIVLTFNLYRLPPVIDVAWYKCKVDHYFPNPMLCKNCQKLGHTTKRCNGNPTCPQCSLPPHEKENCTRTFCTNCSGEHSSTDKECPRYIQTKEILKIKTKNYCSIGEARRMYQSSHPIPQNNKTNTYASITSESPTKRKETVNQQAEKENQQNSQTITSITKNLNYQPSTSKYSTNYNHTSNTTTNTDKPTTTTKTTETAKNLSKITSNIITTKNTNETPYKNTQENNFSQTKTNKFQSPISNLTQQLINTSSYFLPLESLDEISMESSSP